MSTAIHIPADRSPASALSFDGAAHPRLPDHDARNVVNHYLGSTFGLERQMAVLLYDDRAAERGEPRNHTVMQLLPDSFISASGKRSIHGGAVIVGFCDAQGHWASAPLDLITQLVQHERFWIEVRPSPQDPYEQVGPVFGERALALAYAEHWRALIRNRGILGAEVSVAAEVGACPPPPARDQLVADVERAVDGWHERFSARSALQVPAESVPGQCPPSGPGPWPRLLNRPASR
ncbi:hypothetical protein Kisp01_67670 [Kineosporia sp. NBRC 101677]|uniref:hypothetical protein n=1 Tax=Kineosporia sp. NBRC 101677 TaxID=3032197 RepID=UPI0024A18173|nr:hypothetical protein [Kineosporia sp. NBRC 101677]GLY19753.1 hypothetical protein Kisp01_67670 [Kineosporia sp. NBRC 101677]